VIERSGVGLEPGEDGGVFRVEEASDTLST
jgi:hypothetical protein